MKVALLPKKTRGEVVRFTHPHAPGRRAEPVRHAAPTGALTARCSTRGTQDPRPAGVRRRDRQAARQGRLRRRLDRRPRPAARRCARTSARSAAARRRGAAHAGLPRGRVRQAEARARHRARSEPHRAHGDRAARARPARQPVPEGRRALRRDAGRGPGRHRRASRSTDGAGFHGRFVGASHGEIAIVGDFDPAEVRPLLEELFGNWKAAPRPTPACRIRTARRPPRRCASRRPTSPTRSSSARPMRGCRDLDARLRGARRRRTDPRRRSRGAHSHAAAREGGPVATRPAATCNPARSTTSARSASTRSSRRRRSRKVRAALDEELARALDAGFTADEVAAAKRALLEERRTNRAQDDDARRSAREPGVPRPHVRGVGEARRRDRGRRRRRGERRAAQVPAARSHRVGVRRGLREAVTRRPRSPPPLRSSPISPGARWRGGRSSTSIAAPSKRVLAGASTPTWPDWP
ncbi:MAG: insulinase family protein [Comamonadaceae bacterium]|nr:insulinase family protein [Comamonadaceae bacterium]